MRLLTKLALLGAALAIFAGCAAKEYRLVDDRSKARIALTNTAPSPVDIYMNGERVCWYDVGMVGPCIFTPGTYMFEARCDKGGLYARRTLTLRAGESYAWTIRQE